MLLQLNRVNARPRSPYYIHSIMKLNVLGVSAAQGALLHKLKKYVVANVEPRAVFHTPGEEQWKLNFGDIPFVRNLDPVAWDNKRVDVIVGSPNCGHSSMLSLSRKKSFGDAKSDKSLDLFCTAVDEFKPKVFLMENLPALLKQITVEEWKERFPEYKIIVHCHSVIVFGNSQKSRVRLVLVGIHKKAKVNTKAFRTLPTLKQPKTVRELRKGIRKELNYRESPDKTMAMYHYNDKTRRSLRVEEIKKLWRGEFSKDYKWPMKTQKMKTLPGVYRQKLNSPPLTVRPSSRQFNPKGLPLGLEEYRIIMGFPETFKVYFDEDNPTYWLNKGRNTLTKGSVYEVGEWLYRGLSLSFNF